MIKVVSFTILFFFTLIGNIPLKANEETSETTVFFSSDSYLKINGKTNVSKFNCSFNIQAFSNEIKIGYKELENSIQFNSATIQLPNIEFHCGGKAINKDFRKLLRTDEYPKITLSLKEISKQNETSEFINATLSITICNISKDYKIPVKIIKGNEIYVQGLLPIDITDFNLEAPKKMLGMVKVSPEIEIEFALKINEV